MSELNDLETVIEATWEAGDDESLAASREAVERTVELLDQGIVRCAERVEGEWVARGWAKKAILLYFKLRQLEPMEAGPFRYYDKVPLKENYAELGVR
ncbi:MAG: 2,3,4,5-tetrahydropyridine-2,6-dicarboxylate N-succinyltransferase, partial [Gaiellaceae bacterium]